MSPALYATLDALEAGIQEMGRHDPAWHDRMVHRIPQAPSVNRVEWLLNRCHGKVVLHVGCAGPFDALLCKATARCYGIDQTAMVGRPDFFCLDLDRMGCPLPQKEDVEIVLLAEVLEHLLNVKLLFDRIRKQYPQCEVLATVPNAFAPQPRLTDGIEVVNADHNCWYSPYTIRNLFQKCGYEVKEMYFYNGKPPYSEGMIVVSKDMEQ